MAFFLVCSSCGSGRPDLSTWERTQSPRTWSGCFYCCHIHLSSSSSFSTTFILPKQYFYSLSSFHSLSLFQQSLTIHKWRKRRDKMFQGEKWQKTFAATITTCKCHSSRIVPSNQQLHLIERCCSLESFSINVKIKDRGWRKDCVQKDILNVVF